MRYAAPDHICLLLLCLLTAAPAVHGQTMGAEIEGTVVNAQNGRVVPRATVIARNAKKSNDVKSVRADDAGHFLIQGLDAATYRLTAEQQSFFTDAHRRVFQPTVDLSAGEHRSGVLVRILPTAVVTGQIVDEHSDPMQHVGVKLLAREYRKGRLTLNVAGIGLTDDRGEYRIYGVRPGHYYLLAENNRGLHAKGMEVIATTGVVGVIDRSGLLGNAGEPQPEPDITYPPLFYPDTGDFRQATALAVNPGDELHADFVFFSMPSVSITGVVTNALTGQHAKNASVAAYWTDIFGGGGGNFPATAKEDGTFAIRGVAPGTYTLRAAFSDEAGGYTDQRRIDVGVHGAEGVLMAGLPDFDINGKVLLEDSDTKAIKRVWVDFAPASVAGDFRILADGPDLTFQGRMRPGDRYTVNALGLPKDFYLKSVRLGGHDVERNQVVPGGPRETLDLVVSAAGGHIEGLVSDQKDQLVAAAILLIPDEQHRTYFDLFRRTRSDSKGKFILRGIPPGTYKLIAFDGVNPDELINDPDLLKTYEDRGQTVLVTESGQYNLALKLITAE